MKYQEFKKILKASEMKNVTLFCGPEGYLAAACAQQVVKRCIDPDTQDFNFFTFNDRNLSYDEAADAVLSLPVMAEKKLVFFNQAGLFKNKDVAERLASLFADVPSCCYVLVYEPEPDKRAKLYKAIAKAGDVVEFDAPAPGDMKGWASKTLAQQQKTIAARDLDYLLTLLPPFMAPVKTELDKLVNYVGSRGEITRADIDAMVSRPLSDRIFEVANLALSGGEDKALSIISDLRQRRESGVGILTIMANAISELYSVCLYAGEGLPQNEIAAKMNLAANRSWLIKKYMASAKAIGPKKMRAALAMCAKADSGIKNGLVDEWVALEMLVANLKFI